ncbi:hypothetical protein C8A00DRAFT_16966 [Chaetomidium leptoderma]|uniref:Rhodopsin domain-containing protein n=1 Tax=Chaetomidium leptoderma TaxID=669021 RepID=A0AAN6ZVI4_9PEZI|nr:hypothetical protein C8A00DRAFT_16966 [Chaetomidium leptoderma]
MVPDDGFGTVHWGDGKHMDVLDITEKSQVLLWTIAGFFPGIMAFTLPKLAVISLLCRMMNPSRTQRMFMYGLGILLLINAFVCLGMLFGRCRPFRAVWDLTIPPDQSVCWDLGHIVSFAIWTTVVSLVADLYLAIYPSLVLRKLQMSARKKIAFSCALGVGWISVVVTTYKCTRLSSMTSPDFSYDTADLTIWTIVEGSVVTIAATIPVLKPLVDMMFGRGALGDSSYFNNKGDFDSEDPSKSGRSGRSGDIEFSSRKGATTTNIIRSIVGDDNDSEASLVQEGQAQSGPSSSGDYRNTQSRGGVAGIVQTHEVRVAYSSGPDPGLDASQAPGAKSAWSHV